MKTLEDFYVCSFHFSPASLTGMIYLQQEILQSKYVMGEFLPLAVTGSGNLRYISGFPQASLSASLH